MTAPGAGPGAPPRRGMAAVAMVALLLVAAMIVTGMVLAGGRDHGLTLRRVETVRAFYAAEAGMNMAIREMMVGLDEDADGVIGTISDDGDDATDPAFGMAAVVVQQLDDGTQVTVTSDGRAGRARRQVRAVLE